MKAFKLCAICGMGYTYLGAKIVHRISQMILPNFGHVKYNATPYWKK